MWVPWEITVAAAAVLALAGGALWRTTHRAWGYVGGFARETALILTLYSIWQIGGRVAVPNVDGAFDNANWVWDVERWMHLPDEATLQGWFLPHGWLVQAANIFYAVVHVPALIAFLLWLFVRHRDRYPPIRNALALLTGACLLIQLIPVAPPRFVPAFGIIDTPEVYNQSVYRALGHTLPGQLQAMPSVHVAWAVVIGVGVIMVSSSRYRWWALAHPVLTMLVVVVTGNHYWLDGIVAGVLLVPAFAADRLARQIATAVRARTRGRGGILVPAGSAVGATAGR